MVTLIAVQQILVSQKEKLDIKRKNLKRSWEYSTKIRAALITRWYRSYIYNDGDDDADVDDDESFELLEVRH